MNSGNPVQFYLRLIQEDHLETYSTEEVDELLECFSRAPGVDRVIDVSRHPKGGYSVDLEGSKEQLEPLLQFLAARGYRPVI